MAGEVLDDYWSICLINECSEDDAAHLSDARMDSGKNGYSFGVKQFDLATNAEAGDVLAAILAAVRHDPGSKLLPGDIDAIRQGALHKTVAQVKADPALVQLVARASATLSLPAAKTPLHDATLAQMAKELTAVSAQIAGFSDAIGGKKLMRTGSFGLLFLLDYENLFGSTIDKFTPFVAGKTQQLNTDNGVGGTPITASRPFILTDMFRYVLTTKQGSDPGETGTADILRRLNTVVRYVLARDGGHLPLSAVDWTWLKGPLDTMLRSDANPWISKNRRDGEYSVLQALILTHAN